MPFPAEGAEIVLVFDLPHGGPANVVMHAEVSGASPPPPTQADLEDVADEVVTWFDVGTGAGSPQSLFATTVTLESVVVTSRGTVPQRQAVRAPSLSGAGAGDALPAETALVTSWYSSAGIGRRNRGRNYWPGVSEAHNVGGQFNPAEIEAFTDEFENLISRLDTNTPMDLGVYSRLDSSIKSGLTVILRPTFHHITRRNP